MLELLLHALSIPHPEGVDAMALEALRSLLFWRPVIGWKGRANG